MRRGTGDSFLLNFSYAVILCISLLLSACFHTSNHPPTANANLNKVTPNVEDVIILDASLSSDVDGDGLKYEWEIISRPPGSVAQISDASKMKLVCLPKVHLFHNRFPLQLSSENVTSPTCFFFLYIKRKK